MSILGRSGKGTSDGLVEDGETVAASVISRVGIDPLLSSQEPCTSKRRHSDSELFSMRDSMGCTEAEVRAFRSGNGANDWWSQGSSAATGIGVAVARSVSGAAGTGTGARARNMERGYDHRARMGIGLESVGVAMKAGGQAAATASRVASKTATAGQKHTPEPLKGERFTKQSTMGSKGEGSVRIS